jgi:hypothetical protein
MKDIGMLSEILYRGHRIVWDVRRKPGTLFWTGKAALVPPQDLSGVKHIHRITGNDCFLSEEEARDHLVSTARQRVEELTRYESPSTYHKVEL